MEDFISKLASWTKKIIKFNDLIKPILDVPYHENSSLTDIKKGIDMLGINESVNEIVNEIILVYPKLKSSQRQRISDLICDNDRILWAHDSDNQIKTIKDIENQVLWFIIRDQGRDTRDALLELNEIIDSGERLGFNIASVLKKYSSLASTKDKYGWGSTQSIILRSIK